MRIFVFEYITGGGLAGRPILPVLAREGDLMLQALAGDLLEIDGVEVVISRDARLPPPQLPVRVHWVDSRLDLGRAWSAGVQGCDATWPIAPETDGQLERLSIAVLESGGVLLGSRPQAVRVAASKRATAEALHAAGVTVVPTRPFGGRAPADDCCWVVKPDDGVGCIGVRLLRGAASTIADELPGWVIQPYLAGDAASLSVLVGGGDCRLLACNRQRIALEDDRFELLGCEVNGLDGDRAAYQCLGQAVVAAIPGLWGCVGIDLVLTPDGPVVLEVNPRLTTCYAGLSRSLGANVAAMVLDLSGGHRGAAGVGSAWTRVDVDLEQCHVG